MLTRTVEFLWWIGGRLGLAGLAGAGLLAWAGWIECAGLPGVDRELHDTLALAARHDRSHERSSTAQRPSAAALLATLRLELPVDTESNATLAGLVSGAKAAGLEVGSVQFRTEVSAIPGILQHQMELPLKGRYEDLRGWIGLSLRNHPTLTLDSIAVRRKDTETASLEAQVTLTLWSSTRTARPAGQAASRPEAAKDAHA